jgi:hypothetical protein
MQEKAFFEYYTHERTINQDRLRLYPFWMKAISDCCGAAEAGNVW